MIIITILRWLRGIVTFTATGSFPERIINLALKNDITLINPVGQKGELSAQVSINDYKSLCRLRKKAKVKLKITKKRGLPFILYRNRNRGGLAAGFALFLAIINILSMFVWCIDVKGQDTVSTERLKTVLSENGLYIGAYKNNYNIQSLERDISLSLGQVGWFTVNLMGSTAYVSLSESVDKPKIDKTDNPCNLKAKESGQIVKIEVSKGSNTVKVGDGVAKGQMLVSGIVEDEENGKVYIAHSEGKVFAEVHRNQEIAVEKKRSIILPQEEVIERSGIEIMGFFIPTSLKSIPNKQYNTTVKNNSLTINNTALPINIIEETNLLYTPCDITNSKKQAEKLGKIRLCLYDTFSMWDKDITNKKTSINEKKDSYILKSEYTTVEDIAEQTPINFLSN